MKQACGRPVDDDSGVRLRPAGAAWNLDRALGETSAGLSGASANPKSFPRMPLMVASENGGFER